jgi:hypothetical protein
MLFALLSSRSLSSKSFSYSDFNSSLNESAEGSSTLLLSSLDNGFTNELFYKSTIIIDDCLTEGNEDKDKENTLASTTGSKLESTRIKRGSVQEREEQEQKEEGQ